LLQVGVIVQAAVFFKRRVSKKIVFFEMLLFVNSLVGVVVMSENIIFLQRKEFYLFITIIYYIQVGLNFVKIPRNMHCLLALMHILVTRC
jgi:hypothetical protein